MIPSPPPQSARRRRDRPLRWLPRHAGDGVALGLLALCCTVYLWPGLSRLASFGPFDWGVGNSPLGAAFYTHVHNSLNGDVIDEMAPWNSLNWSLIHQGQFPLWNPYTLLGLPQFFNFQSSVLSLPELVGYLFPQRLSLLAAVACKLLLAAYGAYFCGRALGLSRSAAFLAAATFAFSTAFAGQIGWPIDDVMAWTGWIFGLTYLMLQRADRLRRHALLLVPAVAFALYGGFPEGDVILALAAGLFAVTLAVHRVWSGRGLPLRQLAATLLAAVLGCCLAAPLWLPGLQLLAGSVRLAASGYAPLPAGTAATALIPGYYGSPLPASVWFGPANEYELAAYVGLAALVLAGFGFWHRRRRAEVVALALITVVSAALVYAPGPLLTLIHAVPLLRSVQFTRARFVFAFTLALLAGCGLDELRQARDRTALRGYWLSLAAVAGGVIALFVAALANALRPSAGPDAPIRLHAFFWPLVSLALLVAAGWACRRRRADARTGLAGLALVGVVAMQVALLIAASAGTQSYSAAFWPQGPAAADLVRLTGSGLVGFDAGVAPNARQTCLGWLPEVNVGYRLAEFAAFDPMLPRAYETAWNSLSGQSMSAGSVFVPNVTDISVARAFGIRYVLAPATRVRLAPDALRRSARLVAAAGLGSSADAAAVQTLLQVYATRLDLQRAYPPGSPTMWAGLLSWTGPVAAGTVQDCDSDLLAPYAPQLAALQRTIERDPGLGSTLQAGIVRAAAPDPLPGASLVASIGDARLYRIPGSVRFDFAAAPGEARVAAVRRIDPSTWRLVVDLTRPATLRLRLTDVPGWHVSSDGRTVVTRPWHDVMLQVALPPGHHIVLVRYWPSALSLGLCLAALALALVGLLCLPGRVFPFRRRRSSARP